MSGKHTLVRLLKWWLDCVNNKSSMWRGAIFMSAQALRQRYNRTFAGMEKHTRSSAWLIVGLYTFQIFTAVCLGHFLLQGGAGVLAWIGVAVLMLFIATRMRGLNNIVHECSHATFAAKRSDNVLIGKVCASLLFNSFTIYRDEHLTHHKHIGDYEHDLDLQGIKNLGLHDRLTFWVVLRHLTTPLILRHLPYYLSLNLSRKDGFVFQLLQYALIGVVSVITALAPMTGIFMLILPFVMVYSALMYWADCMDHAGLVPSPDDLESSRNLLAPHVLRWLFFPRNDCFHLVHHLFPHIPARYLEVSHQALLEDEIYVSRENAVRGMSGVKAQPIGTMTPAE